MLFNKCIVEHIKQYKQFKQRCDVWNNAVAPNIVNQI